MAELLIAVTIGLPVLMVVWFGFLFILLFATMWVSGALFYLLEGRVPMSILALMFPFVGIYKSVLSVIKEKRGEK